MTPTLKTNRPTNSINTSTARSARSVRIDAAHDVGINAAFLQEVKDDERQVAEILSVVASMLEEPRLQPEDSSELLAVMRRFYTLVKFRFGLEEAIGYMEDVIEVSPWLCRDAEALLDEHQPLLEELQEIVELAHLELREGANELKLKQVRDRFAAFRTRFSEHESRESDLIIDSLYFDIGGGD